MNMAKSSAYDAVIVLGGGIHADGSLPSLSRSRLDYALTLREREGVPLVLTGKWSLLLDTPPSRTEASAMRDYALAIGSVAAEQIILEEQSMETIGNAYYIKTTVMEPNGWQRAVAVTSEYHTERAEQTFRKVFGPDYTIDFVAAPSGLDVREIAAKREVEATLSAFTTKLLASVTDGDTTGVWRALQQLPGYGDNPSFTRAELLDIVQSGPPAPDTYTLSGK
jgi:uncharacterized SAM-binding protein YcdF (DUF218 family)